MISTYHVTILIGGMTGWIIEYIYPPFFYSCLTTLNEPSLPEFTQDRQHFTGVQHEAIESVFPCLWSFEILTTSVEVRGYNGWIDIRGGIGSVYEGVTSFSCPLISLADWMTSPLRICESNSLPLSTYLHKTTKHQWWECCQSLHHVVLGHARKGATDADNMFEGPSAVLCDCVQWCMIASST